MDKNDIYKNVRDLEYQHLLNVQNIVLGFIGAMIIAVSFLSEIPPNWPDRQEIIFLLLFLAVFFFFYFYKELRKIINSIRGIQIPSQNNPANSIKRFNY